MDGSAGSESAFDSRCNEIKTATAVGNMICDIFLPKVFKSEQIQTQAPSALSRSRAKVEKGDGRKPIV